MRSFRLAAAGCIKPPTRRTSTTSRQRSAAPRPGAVLPSALWRASRPKTKHAVLAQMWRQSQRRCAAFDRRVTMPYHAGYSNGGPVPYHAGYSNGGAGVISRTRAARDAQRLRRVAGRTQGAARAGVVRTAHKLINKCGRWPVPVGAICIPVAASDGTGPVCLLVCLFLCGLFFCFFAPIIRFMLCEHCAASGAVPQALAALRLCARSTKRVGWGRRGAAMSLFICLLACSLASCTLLWLQHGVPSCITPAGAGPF